MKKEQRQPDLKSSIENVSIIASLPSGEKSSLVSKIKISQVRKGQYIVKEGAERSDLIFVSSGHLKVCHCDRRGKEVIFSLLVAGDFFGEIALLTGSNRSADVIALAPSTVLILEQKDFLQHIDKYTGLSKAMLKAMANRIRVASQRITDLALFDVSCRVARALWSLGQVHETEGSKHSKVINKPTQQTLAGMVGCSREVVSRALKSLEADGNVAYIEGVLTVKSLP